MLEKFWFRPQNVSFADSTGTPSNVGENCHIQAPVPHPLLQQAPVAVDLGVVSTMLGGKNGPI